MTGVQIACHYLHQINSNPNTDPNPNPNTNSDRLIGRSRLSFCIDHPLWGSVIGHPSNS